MKQMHCPLNGLRNIDEFVYGGEYHPDAEPTETDARACARQVFFHHNHCKHSELGRIVDV